YRLAERPPAKPAVPLWNLLHPHGVIAGVHVEGGPRDVLGAVAEQIGGGRADVVRADVTVERRALLDDRLHRREAGDGTGGERPHRAGRDRVDADVLLPEIPGEVAN